VLAPGLPEDTDYLRGLGAAEVLDRNGDVAAQVRERYPDGVDALADFASGSPDQLNAYAAVVRDGGRIASRAGAAGEGPGRTNVGAAPTTENLDRLAGLLEDGTLSVPIQASYPLAQVDQALKILGGQHTKASLPASPVGRRHRGWTGPRQSVERRSAQRSSSAPTRVRGWGGLGPVGQG